MAARCRGCAVSTPPPVSCSCHSLYRFGRRFIPSTSCPLSSTAPAQIAQIARAAASVARRRLSRATSARTRGAAAGAARTRLSCVPRAHRAPASTTPAHGPRATLCGGPCRVLQGRRPRRAGLRRARARDAVVVSDGDRGDDDRVASLSASVSTPRTPRAPRRASSRLSVASTSERTSSLKWVDTEQQPGWTRSNSTAWVLTGGPERMAPMPQGPASLAVVSSRCDVGTETRTACQLRDTRTRGAAVLALDCADLEFAAW